jgi:hypothetical protein
MRISTLLAGAAAIALLSSLGACMVPADEPGPVSRAGGAVEPPPSVYYGPTVGVDYGDERGRWR